MTLLEKIKNHPAVKDIEDDGGCCGYTHWVTDLRYPRVSRHKDYTGCIRRLTVRCTLHSASDDAPGKIIYTFGIGKKGGHRVEIKAT